MILPELPDVAITLRRSPRARRISLRISGLDGKVTLTLPRRAREADALAFARARSDWIRDALGRIPAQVRVEHGVVLPVEGRLLRIEPAAGLRTPRIGETALLIPGPADTAGRRAAIFLRHLARERLVSACDRHAARLGRIPGPIRLRDTRSRWGSCSADGALMFSWRLAMAPPEVLDYVAAHEVAHLEQMNHSPAFWAVVARLVPGYAGPRQWLRRHGAGLHGFRFGD
ncbi:MAG: M48 family metallopeptidase [Gemmobacter sp.]